MDPSLWGPMSPELEALRFRDFNPCLVLGLGYFTLLRRLTVPSEAIYLGRDSETGKLLQLQVLDPALGPEIARVCYVAVSIGHYYEGVDKDWAELAGVWNGRDPELTAILEKWLAGSKASFVAYCANQGIHPEETMPWLRPIPTDYEA